MSAGMGEGNGILTLAFGDTKYKTQAIALARSLQLHYPTAKRAIITDDIDGPAAQFYDFVVPLNPAFGPNVEQKLHMDFYSPFDRTLYIDGDCLVVRDLDAAWTMFTEDNPVAVVGENNAYDGSWLGADLATVRADLKIVGPIPNFNSGLIYWDSSDTAHAVFSRARELVSEYKRLGFGKVGNRWAMSDEPLIGIAMAEHGLLATDDGGSMMRTMIGLRGPLHIDVIQGKCRFNKAGTVVEPAIAHFAGRYSKSLYYKRERMRLRFAVGKPA